MNNSKGRVSYDAVVIDDCGRKKYMGRIYAEVVSSKKQSIDGKLKAVDNDWREVVVCTRERLWDEWSNIQRSLNDLFKSNIVLHPFKPDKAVFWCKDAEMLGKKRILFVGFGRSDSTKKGVSVGGYEEEDFQIPGVNAKGWNKQRKNNLIKIKWMTQKPIQFYRRCNKKKKKVELRAGEEREDQNDGEVLRWESSFRVGARNRNEDDMDDSGSDSEESFEDCSSIDEGSNAPSDEESRLATLFNGGEIETSSGINSGGWGSNLQEKSGKCGCYKGEEGLSYIFGNELGTIFTICGGGLGAGNSGNKLMTSVFYKELVKGYKTNSVVTIRKGIGVEDGGSSEKEQEREGVELVADERNKNKGCGDENMLPIGATNAQSLENGKWLGVSLNKSEKYNKLLEDWG
ncbi:hypothetical protein LguiB_013134 [Lonicera macranthoides]